MRQRAPDRPFVWQPQEGPQAALIACPVYEILYGGARGGGKTDGILGKYGLKQKRYGAAFNGVVFRREMPQSDDLWERAKDLYGPLGARINETKKSFRFPSGGRVRLRPLENVQSAAKYQGQNLTDAAVEEAGNFPDPAPIMQLNGCLRSAEGVPTQLILTANPGGPGHQWIKARYIDPAPRGMKIIKDRFQIHTPDGVREEERSRVFIPAKVWDNRILLARDPAYPASLHMVGDAELVKAWLEGNWNIVAGSVFADVWDQDWHLIPPFPIPRTWYVDRSFDWGSAKPFSVGWWAESDGCDIVQPDGSRTPTLPGDLFRIAEWYGWNGKPNEGCRMVDSEVARGILEREAAMGLKVHAGPADSAIFDEINADSIAKRHGRMGVRWLPCIKGPGSRVRGWQLLRRRLRAAKQWPREEPGLFVFDTCVDFARTVPTLPRAKPPKNPEDVDSEAEDHVGDDTRYRLTFQRGKAHSREI